MPAKRLKRWLPFLAVFGALVVLVTVILSGEHQQAFLVDTGETRPLVEKALDQLRGRHPASIDDAAFRRSVEALLNQRHIATVWLFAPDGRTVYSAGSTAAFLGTGRLAAEGASIDVRGVLDTLPGDLLSPKQRTMILAASYIRAEWTHNDIYRHLLVPVQGADGSTVALVGVGYTVARTAHDEIGLLGFLLGALVGLAGFALYWLSLPLWVLLDAREHGERAWPWAVFVLLGNLVALVAYLLVRLPQRDGALPASP